MKKWVVVITSALVLVVILTLTALAAVPKSKTVDEPLLSSEEPPQPSETGGDIALLHQPPEAISISGVTLNVTDHVAYIQGLGQGMFSPIRDITRAEAAVILHRLLTGAVPVTVSYTDVPEDIWYAEAAGQLGSLGVLRADETTFLGDEPITRGEFVSCIAAFFPMRTDAEQFSDVPSTYQYADAILSCRAYGWLTGYEDGTFRAEQPIQRGEAVAVINRALGRTSDHASIAANRPALFLDVSTDAWYYYDVMEATVPHTFVIIRNTAERWTSCTQTDTGLPADFRTEGIHLHQGWSYYYSDSANDILRSRTRYGYTYDADGHFTTGDPWVDEQLRQIVLSRTNADMTGDEMLRAFFAYCRDNYRYLKWNTYKAGDTSFTLAAARQMLSTGRGNCYCYASVFWYLARWIGYDAKIYSGSVLDGPHSWVEIDGYIYDTQLEWRYVHDWGRSGYLWTFYHLKDSRDTFRYRK